MSIALLFMVAACATTRPAQDTAELASRQLLRLETEVQSAAEVLYDRYELQQSFVEQNLRAAAEAENLTNGLQREWQVSANTAAERLFDAVRATRDSQIRVPSAAKKQKFSVSTAALKKAIKDLGAVSDTLANRDTAEAFLRFGHEVQEKFDELKEADDE